MAASSSATTPPPPAPPALRTPTDAFIALHVALFSQSKPALAAVVGVAAAASPPPTPGLGLGVELLEAVGVGANEFAVTSLDLCRDAVRGACGW